MALEIMKPKSTTPAALNEHGIGGLSCIDIEQMCVVIAVCIDGGPVTQEEQRTSITILDEVVFDLRQKGVAWAQNTAILIAISFDVGSFVQSLYTGNGI